MKRLAGLAALSVLALSVAGCVPKPKFLAEGVAPPRNVAFLPMRNQSLKIEAPKIMRMKLTETFRARGYDIMDSERVDEVLKKDFGITEGGQLNAATPEEIAEKLGVGGLFYAEVTDFSFKNLGVYQSRTVGIKAYLVDAKGQKIWEDEAKFSRKKIATSVADIRNMGLAGLAEQTLGKIIKHHPLGVQMNQCASRLSRTLP